MPPVHALRSRSKAAHCLPALTLRSSVSERPACDASACADGKVLLVGAEAGSSDSHFEDYWLFDPASRSFKYVGGGNGAQWSPDSSKILWSTPRSLGPIGKIHVWVSHLVVVDVHTLEQQSLTSGTSYEDSFFWCSSGTR